MSLSDATPLGNARAWLRQRVDQGEKCPCCTQMAKVYRRKINAGMARSLITMYHVGGLTWVHLPTQIGARSREEGKLAYWGLIEERALKRGDGGRAGEWRVTTKGELFLRNRMAVPKYARVFDGRLLGLDSTEMVTITDVIGDSFSYDELMRGI